VVPIDATQNRGNAASVRGATVGAQRRQPSLRRATSHDAHRQLTDVRKTYRSGSLPWTSSGVTAHIDEGEYVAIWVRPARQITLMNILGCLDVPSAGSYLLGGEVAHDRERSAVVRTAHRVRSSSSTCWRR
jgi:hypothetical protein